MESTVSAEELRSLFASREPLVLIDVREPFELSNGMIPSAKSLPLGQLSDALDLSVPAFAKRFGFPKPSKDQKIVFYCRTGGRSAAATRIAVQKGFAALNFAGSVFEWSKTDPAVKFYGPAPVGR
jgi:rhodanese-related sulfurtransferase